jgi:hypothetical protein
VSLRLLGLLLAAIFSLASPAAAQRVADLRPVGVVHLRESATPSPSIPRVAGASKRHHLWPWFMLGGAVAGAGTVALVVARNCKLDCQDDGGYAYAPYYAAAAAGVGALAGALLGVVVDLSRSDPAPAPNGGP